MSSATAPARRGRLRRADCAGPGIRRIRRGRGFSYEDGRGVDRRRGDAGADPAAGDPAGLEGSLDLPRPLRPHPGDRLRRSGPQAVPLPRALAAAAGGTEVRAGARVRPRAAEAAPRRHRRPARARGCRASGRWPARVRLLDLGFFRVGSEVYAEENESFGLATVRREHVTISAARSVFDFPAKSGQRRVQSIRDAAARRAIEAMHRRRSGPEDLLAYRSGREWVDVRSDEINDYIHEKIGDEFTAKNFRTWHGTVLAAVALAGEEPPRSEAAAKRAISARGQPGLRGARQHPGRLPRLLHRPPRPRPLPRRHDDPPAGERQRTDDRQAAAEDRARSDRARRLSQARLATGSAPQAAGVPPESQSQ